MKKPPRPAATDRTRGARPARSASSRTPTGRPADTGGRAKTSTPASEGQGRSAHPSNRPVQAPGRSSQPSRGNTAAKTAAPSASKQPSARGRSGSPGLVISQASARFVEGGHPWVTRDRDTGDTTRLRSGEVLDLVNPAGEWVARGLIDPDARIVARVLTKDRKLLCDAGLFQARALEALELRGGLEHEASMYRLVNAESDGLPGLTVDRYGDWLVAHLYTEAAGWLASAALEALVHTGRFRGAYLKMLPRDRRGAGEDAPGRWVAGEPGPETLIEHEHGIKLQVRPFSGLSTGIFLDMRDNRRRVAELARGRKVLNAFAYTGAFSVACAARGASVDTLDLSAKTLSWARENFALNNLNPDEHRFLAEDAFPFLASAAGQYDVVIIDPPTFSTSRGNVWSPARLAELNVLAMSATRPGGWLVSFSNFASLSEADFIAALKAAAAESRRGLQIGAILQPGIDFPWLPAFPESRHLKGVMARLPRLA